MSRSWILDFLRRRENKYFCEIDAKFLVDRFNYFELDNQVRHYSEAIKLINDDHDADPKYQEDAKKLYGLLHRRFILETRGMLRMVPKYSQKDFGSCPRSFCQEHPVLPIGLSDDWGTGHVRLYCANCEDVYLPKKDCFKRIDGAFFGTTFAHLFFLNVPKLLLRGDNAEEKDQGLVQELQKKNVPKVFGFRLHRLWHSVSLQGIDEHHHDLLVYGKKRAAKEEGAHSLSLRALRRRVAEQEEELHLLRRMSRMEGQQPDHGDHADFKALGDRMRALCERLDAKTLKATNNGLVEDMKALREQMRVLGKWMDGVQCLADPVHAGDAKEYQTSCH